ncbi:hypothetical protein C8R46DRAFT_201493 [Mycena filopes]|nr:hypothetical protein C8R46DRAFT_201493 [Mycena filopes]
MSLSRLISFPDDFDPSQPALAPNAPVSEPATLGTADFCDLPALEGPDESMTAPSSLTSSASSADTVISHFTPGETGAAGAEPASTVDPAALAAAVAAPPPSSNRRSLSRQTSATFHTAAASANIGGRGKAPATSNAPKAAAPGPSGVNHAYLALGLSPTPTGSEPAAAHRGRHNDNEAGIVNTVYGLSNDMQSQHRINREQNEETRLMITEARINASEEMRKLSIIQHADHNVLATLLNAVNAMRRDLAALRTERPLLAPLPALTDSTPLPPPLSAPRPSGATMGPPPSDAGPSGLRHDAPPPYDDAPAAKRQRTVSTVTAPPQDEPYDVHFYDVATTGEPRDIARAAMQAIPHLNAGSFLNAIRVRGKPGTISIRFRTRPFALTFIDAIENCPPANLDGLHACWAPTLLDPIAVIRGEGYSGRSASG